MVTNIPDADGFRTVTLRCSAGGRPAILDSGDTIYAGDSLKLVITGAFGMDAAAAVVGFYTDDGDSILLSNAGEAPYFTETLANPGTFYATVSLATDAALGHAATGSATEPAVMRCYVYDGTVTWADILFQLKPQPLALGGETGGEPSVGGAFVTKAALASIAATLAGMDTLTPAQREARMNRLVADLANL